MKIPRNISSELPRIGPSENPSKYPEEALPWYPEELSDEHVVLGISSEICFLGIPSENSEGFPRSYFRGLVSSMRGKVKLLCALSPYAPTRRSSFLRLMVQLIGNNGALVSFLSHIFSGFNDFSATSTAFRASCISLELEKCDTELFHTLRFSKVPLTFSTFTFFLFLNTPSPKSVFPPCSLTCKPLLVRAFSASAAVKDTPVTKASDATGIHVSISYVSNKLNVTDSLRVVSFGLN
ncbi:hypothetical protein DY000_02040601 [Brassica cretica]|uniref:Uncharacterized protein n=1 Tax=Brassica cretica TaxID=69181 RepID=A0ABQ7BJW6_BRACR|nr:hypothetical protein DY000_02040601 [Brassica cretica]